MFRIIYVSTATQPFSENDLRELLTVARANNAAAGVTGMLVYSQATFLQALEGEAGTVIAVFDRINRDTRHTAVKTLQRGDFPGSEFDNWAMGFHCPDDRTSTGHVAVSNRIKLSLLDEFLALDFLRSCSRNQTL